ncbi:MAG TPA: hypothetical protein VKV06_02335 [Acidimicrobiales bacterium]|nr:hypothetical protein [Acidimicrobiales bacterium]
MAFLLGPRRYLRTCRICGDHWEVTRRQARSHRRMRRPRFSRAGGTGRGRLDVHGTVADYEAMVETLQGYRRCPHCGIDDFAQEPLPRRSR